MVGEAVALLLAHHTIFSLEWKCPFPYRLDGPARLTPPPEDRPQQRRCGEREQRRRKRVRDEHAHVPLADGEGAAELLLGERAEDQADDRRRHREAEPP